MILGNCDPEFEWAVRAIRGQIIVELNDTEFSWQA
jgi:hypothetical protein